MRALAIACGLLCGLLLVGLPAPVSAQVDVPAHIVAGGYSFMRDDGLEENFPAGWFVSGAHTLWDWLAAVGEVSGGYKDFDFSVAGTTFSTRARVHTFLGGARYQRALARLTPFVQLLAGVARASGGVRVFRLSIAEAQTEFALQPGGGVDIALTDRVGARLAADYRRIFAEDEDNEFRFAAGVVVGWGSR